MHGAKTLIIAAAALLAAACTPQDVPPPTGPIAEGPGSTGQICGGIAGFQCKSADDYCLMADGQCRMPDAAGTCTPKPQACTREYRPVCGCDGNTYSNPCEAKASGASIAHDGQCTNG